MKPEHPIQRVALYVRTFTPDQNPEMQFRELRQYAERHGWQVAGEFVDYGITVSKHSRAQLYRMMSAAYQYQYQRKFEAILCWKLDRFGRSLKHLLTLLDDLESQAIVLLSLRDGLDLSSTPSGRLMFHAIAD